MKSVSGTFADEQQEDIAKFHLLEGEAKHPNTGKAPLEMCKDTSMVCNERILISEVVVSTFPTKEKT